LSFLSRLLKKGTVLLLAERPVPLFFDKIIEKQVGGCLMFSSWKNFLEEELSGRQAFRYADRIAQYHRIQASPGYRQAAQEVVSLLKRDGVEAELVSYPAQFGDRFLSHRSFQEWTCEQAELWVETPVRKRIARFTEEEISVVQRSISTPEDGVNAELIVIENAEEESSYEGLDLEGKIALVRGNQFIIHMLAVEKYKCAGLIFDNLSEFPPIRTRMDMPDSRQYTSYWWHTEEEIKSFGFVVSPRIGEELRALAKHGKVKLNAFVRAHLQDGHFENVEYFIPGKTNQEILLVSHLCHPYPGGQDNASGPGTLMEVMRTLTRLIAEEKLSQPELGIRFLLMPEMTGTAAYFHQHPERIPNTVAALNLDMVGADQTKGGGPVCVEQPPMAMPTFVDRFAYKLVEGLANNVGNFSGTTSYSTVNYVATRFSGGSDHYIISDPAIGIPCPMLIQWPDKYYHTSSDSTKHLDENMMKLVGRAAALYSYGLANGEEEDWLAYASEHIGQIGGNLFKAKEFVMKSKLPAEALSFYRKYEEEVLAQLLAYANMRGFTSLVTYIRQKQGYISKHAELIFEEAPLLPDDHQLDEDWMNAVYRRTHKAPLRVGDEIKDLPLEERYHWLKKVEATVPMGYADFLFYWMDGQRTVREILTLTRYETGQYFPEYTEELLKLCLSLGLITRV
jgi:aminopeptidase YwaD